MADNDRPTRQEDEYFAREDVDNLRRLANKQKQDLEAKQQESLRALHHMKCPKCGFDLHTLRRGAVDVDTCFHCHGVWLDAGELEQVLEEHRTGKSSVVEAVLNVFKAGKGTQP